MMIFVAHSMFVGVSLQGLQLSPILLLFSMGALLSDFVYHVALLRVTFCVCILCLMLNGDAGVLFGFICVLRNTFADVGGIASVAAVCFLPLLPGCTVRHVSAVADAFDVDVFLL